MDHERITSQLVDHFKQSGLADVQLGIDHNSPWAPYFHGERNLRSSNYDYINLPSGEELCEVFAAFHEYQQTGVVPARMLERAEQEREYGREVTPWVYEPKDPGIFDFGTVDVSGELNTWEQVSYILHGQQATNQGFYLQPGEVLRDLQRGLQMDAESFRAAFGIDPDLPLILTRFKAHFIQTPILLLHEGQHAKDYSAGFEDDEYLEVQMEKNRQSEDTPLTGIPYRIYEMLTDLRAGLVGYALGLDTDFNLSYIGLGNGMRREDFKRICDDIIQTYGNPKKGMIPLLRGLKERFVSSHPDRYLDFFFEASGLRERYSDEAYGLQEDKLFEDCVQTTLDRLIELEECDVPALLPEELQSKN